MQKYSFDDFLTILEPLYVTKDAVHGPAHIRRLYAKAFVFARKKKIDALALALATALHGVVSDKKAEAQRLLLVKEVSGQLLEKGMSIALESQTEAVPSTLEGKILHDARLCEGGEYFLAVKSLATANLHAYPLDESYNWVIENIINNPRRQCYLPEAKREYAKKLRCLKEIWAELGEILKR